MPWLMCADLGDYRTGWIAGEPGTTPRANTLRLRKAGERPEDSVARLACFLRDRFEERIPDLLCLEGLIPAGAMAGMTTSFVREGQTLLHGAARAISAAYGCPVRAPGLSAIRVHFLGQRSMAAKRQRGHKRTPKEAAQDRAATKRAILDRAILLGYLPRGSLEEDAGDAAALFDFASNHFFNKSGGFAMFGAENAGRAE